MYIYHALSDMYGPGYTIKKTNTQKTKESKSQIIHHTHLHTSWPHHFMFETDEERNEYGWSRKADVWQNAGIFI